MKKIIIFVLFLFFTVASHGQIKFGVSGGVNFSYVTPEEVTVGDHTISTLDDYHTGFHIGALTQISLPRRIFIQPEILYTSIGNYMVIYDEVEAQRTDYLRKINRLDLPVMVGPKIGNLRFGLGPVGSIIIGESSELDIEGSKEEYSTMTFGLQVGVGANISNLLIDLKFESGLTSFGDKITIHDEMNRLDSRPRQIIISLGILL